MRCRACNTLLSDIESRRKDLRGVHMDLCGPCGTVSFETWYQATEENSFDTQKKTLDKVSQR